MILLTEIDLLSIEFICFNMREVDRKEVFAIVPHDNAYRLGWETYHTILNNGRGRVAWHNGRPAALAAFVENWPGVWQVYMYGTDDFRAAAIPLLRWFRKEANEILSVCNGHRLQCHSQVGHPEADKMIRAMGGIPEGQPLRKFGKDGSDFQTYVWLNGENDAVLKPGFIRAA